MLNPRYLKKYEHLSSGFIEMLKKIAAENNLHDEELGSWMND